ncbi:MAG: class I SAM-dependent methyltransferase [Verrucomicrobiota bacterium]
MNAALAEFPLQLGPPGTLAAIRAGLAAMGFDSETLCRELEIESMADLGKAARANKPFEQRPERFRDWAGVFLFGAACPRSQLQSALGQTLLDALLAVGLLRPARDPQEGLISPVFLYPVNGFIVASDRYDDPDQPGSRRDSQADVVFPGIFGGTLRFLELLPDAPGGEALDLCGGCGIGALSLARQARLAVSADITPRATLFAEFNGLLNGCPNMEAVCGNLYAPVSGAQYDLITAHPPYVPALGDPMIYRDAGDAGEDITNAIVAGLSTHLRPGGTALVLCQGRDTVEGTFEQRVRRWLGTAHNEFDIIFALQTTKTIEAEAAEMSRRVSKPDHHQLVELVERFRALGTRQFVYGALVLRRHLTEGEPATLRTRLAFQTRAKDFDSLLQWIERRRQPGFREWFGQARLRLSPACQLTVRHVVQDEQLVPAEFTFEVDQPFPAAMRIDGWVTPLVARLNGATTPVEVYAAARAADELPPDFRLDDFASLLALLVERGFLRSS